MSACQYYNNLITMGLPCGCKECSDARCALTKSYQNVSPENIPFFSFGGTHMCNSMISASLHGQTRNWSIAKDRYERGSWGLPFVCKNPPMNCVRTRMADRPHGTTNYHWWYVTSPVTTTNICLSTLKCNKPPERFKFSVSKLNAYKCK